MTVSDAAKLLEVSKALVYQLLKAGRIAHERHGLGRGVIRIDPVSLEEYRLGCRVEMTGELRPSLRVVRRIEVPDMLSEIRRQKAARRRT